MRSSVILFAGDLVDEGYDRVLDTIRDRAGADAVTMACNYHHSRDVLPHNPRRKVVFMRGGVYFKPDPALFEGLKIQPDVAAIAQEDDPLARLVGAAERRGMQVRGWTNNMHSTIHGSAHPDCAVENAFGDTYITTLCPANPDTRAYVRALAANLGRYRLQRYMAESLSFMPFDHGYHHERTMVPITQTVKYLMSLCFCPHCRAVAERAGVAVEALRDFARREVDLALNGEDSRLDGVPLEEAAVGALGGGELRGFLEARKGTVASLVAELAEASGPVPFGIMEWSGGLRAVGAGMQVSAATGTAVDRAWQDGVDIAEVARRCTGLTVLGYVPDPEVLRADLRAYRALVPRDQPISVALRPMPPDCATPEALAAKLRVLAEEDVASVDYYHYGFMRLASLDWIGRAGRTVH